MRFFALFCLGVLATAARTDVITTQRLVTPGSPIARAPATVTLASDDALLTESWGGRFGADGASYQRTLQLTRYAKNEIVTMYVALKIYKIEPLAPELLPGMKMPGIRVTHLADEKVLGYNTHHFFVDLSFDDPAASAAPRPILMRQEVWLLPVTSNPLLPNQTRNLRGVEMASVSGDAQFWPEIQSGVWIKKSVFNPVAPTTTPTTIVLTEEVSSLAICLPLAPALFEIPSDYRQLSPAAYADALAKDKGAKLERKMAEMDRNDNQPAKP